MMRRVRLLETRTSPGNTCAGWRPGLVLRSDGACSNNARILLEGRRNPSTSTAVGANS
jgi:hypothetical protein